MVWPPDVPGDAGVGAPWQLFFARHGEMGERGPAGLPRRVEAQGENVRSESQRGAFILPSVCFCETPSNSSALSSLAPELIQDRGLQELC